MRALSEDKAAAISEARPGDRCLAMVGGEWVDTVLVDAVHQDPSGNLIYQLEDGRVLEGNRLFGQVGTIISVHEEPEDESPLFSRGGTIEHLSLPFAMQLFGYALEAVNKGFAAECPFCLSCLLTLYQRKGLWLFETACGRTGDLVDFVGGVLFGPGWPPEELHFDDMMKIILDAIHKKLEEGAGR